MHEDVTVIARLSHHQRAYTGLSIGPIDCLLIYHDMWSKKDGVFVKLKQIQL